MFGWFDGFVRGFVLIIDTFFDGVFLTFFILFTNVSLYVLIFLYSFTVGLLYFTEKLIEVEFTENRTDFDSTLFQYSQMLEGSLEAGGL